MWADRYINTLQFNNDSVSFSFSLIGIICMFIFACEICSCKLNFCLSLFTLRDSPPHTGGTVCAGGWNIWLYGISEFYLPKHIIHVRMEKFMAFFFIKKNTYIQLNIDSPLCMTLWIDMSHTYIHACLRAHAWACFFCVHIFLYIYSFCHTYIRISIYLLCFYDFFSLLLSVHPYIQAHRHGFKYRVWYYSPPISLLPFYGGVWQ